MNKYFIYQRRHNTVKTVNSRTVSTGQKGSKSTCNCSNTTALTRVTRKHQAHDGDLLQLSWGIVLGQTRTILQSLLQKRSGIKATAESFTQSRLAHHCALGDHMHNCCGHDRLQQTTAAHFPGVSRTSSRAFSRTFMLFYFQTISITTGWLGSRVVSMLDSGVEGPRFKSQPRHCRVTV